MLGNVRREQVDMLKISVFSYKSRKLRVHRSVSLKYLRFPDQHIKGNIDSLIDAEKNKVLCGESLPQEKTHYPCMFIPFLTEKVSSFEYFPLKK